MHIYPFFKIQLSGPTIYLTQTKRWRISILCADAGPDRCAFWAPSADDIRQNLTNLYDSISVQPVPVKTGDTYSYVDYKIIWSIDPYLLRSLHTVI
jgi:hypothetical protein